MGLPDPAATFDRCVTFLGRAAPLQAQNRYARLGNRVPGRKFSAAGYFEEARDSLRIFKVRLGDVLCVWSVLRPLVRNLGGGRQVQRRPGPESYDPCQ